MALSSDANYMPLPESFPIQDRPIWEHMSMVSISQHEHRVKALEWWMRVRTEGAATMTFYSEPIEAYVRMHAADLRETHGSYILVVTPSDDVVSEPKLSEPMEDLPPLYCTMRRNDIGIILDVDNEAVRMFGHAREEVVGERALDFIHPDDHERSIDSWISMLARPGSTLRWRNRHLCGDGTWKWVEGTHHNRLNDPEHVDIMSEYLDITSEMQIHAELAASEAVIRELANELPVGVLRVDAQSQITFVNQHIHAVLGRGEITAVADLIQRFELRDAIRLSEAVASVLLHGRGQELEIRTPDSAQVRGRICNTIVRPLIGDDGSSNGALICIDDVTEAAELREQLQHRATYDELTGCFNRAATVEMLQRHLAAPGLTGLAFIDLNGFKEVNDVHGHAAGDAVLVDVARRLRSTVRITDIVGRLGGDEFVVIYPSLNSRAELIQYCDHLQNATSAVVNVGVTEVVVSASIGATLAMTGESADRVLARADHTMYAAKKADAIEPLVTEPLDNPDPTVSIDASGHTRQRDRSASSGLLSRTGARDGSEPVQPPS